MSGKFPNVSKKLAYLTYKENIDLLVKLYPASFNKQFPLPLELNVHKEIARKTGWSAEKTSMVLNIWTTRMEYVMMACSTGKRFKLHSVAMKIRSPIDPEPMAGFSNRLKSFRDRGRVVKFKHDFLYKFGYEAFQFVV